MPLLLKDVDARTRLAGANRLEILLFSLESMRPQGGRETFGINVFKVREVMRAPAVTRAPDMPPAVEGIVSLRGTLVPVIDLAKYLGIAADGARPGIMLVTEYNEQILGFLIARVGTILRLEWSAMRVPPGVINGLLGGLVTALTELADGSLVMMLDLEAILDKVLGGADEEPPCPITGASVPAGRTVLSADDSAIARKQISRTLEALGVKHLSAVNGKQAWHELGRIAASVSGSGQSVRDRVQLVLTDVEMPEMDGYMLTKKIKSDPRFAGIPVVMHSSLSGAANRQLGLSVGVDDYVPKFGSDRLAHMLSRFLA